MDRVPAPGGESQAVDFRAAPGGGFAFLLAAKRAGVEVVHCCPHGTGPHGDAVRAGLARAGIATLSGPDPRGDTGHCVVLIAPDGERTMVSWPGVESRVPAERVRAVAAHTGIQPHQLRPDLFEAPASDAAA